MHWYGGIETGGTTVGCIIGSGPDDVVAQERFPTAAPRDTIARIADFFRQHSTESPVEAVGIGAFGPLDLYPSSQTYGFVTDTPKPGWSDVDLLGAIQSALQVPVFIDTDVNAAALAEYLWGAEGASTAPDPLLYLTVGTGIGLGVIIEGKPFHGLLHPEAGHIRLPHDWALDPFEGSCPFHGDCWEGLASGTAIEKRWGQPGDTLPPDHPAWELEAHYLGLGVADLICCFSPRRLVIGGGVMSRPAMLDRVRLKTREAIGGYLKPRPPLQHMDELIFAPRLGQRAGLLGALALAIPR